MRVWEIVSDGGIDELVLNDRPEPAPGSGQILVRVRASSINYRDLSTVEDPVSRGLCLPAIPNSDAAGEVVAIGSGVEGFANGDRVMGCFFQDWQSGPISGGAMASALGGARPGVLAELIALDARGVVPVPAHLSWAEASTLPCAALTAWHALTRPRHVRPGETVLLLGTGGVSVFAQQFCQLMGARTIVTSSNDDKLERMRSLGAAEAINYRGTADWDSAVLDLTKGVGVDRVVEGGGPGTLQRSINTCRVGGLIALIGILTGAQGTVTPTDIMRKSITLKGIYVGSRHMFLEMNKAISFHRLSPVIDEVFDFPRAPGAYHRMRSGRHFGKLVIEVG